MNLDKFFNILGLIVTVGLVTVLVSSAQTAQIIGAMGNAFTGSLRAAMGR